MKSKADFTRKDSRVNEGHVPTVVDIHKHDRLRPAFDLYIGRYVQYTEFGEDSKWCNPFTVEMWGVYALPMFEVYARWLVSNVSTKDMMLSIKYDNTALYHFFKNAIIRWGAGSWDLNELTGKRLGCWCITTGSCEPPLTCHGQILMKLWTDLL